MRNSRLLAVLALGLSACGSSEEDAKPTTRPADASAEKSSLPEASQPDRAADVAVDGELPDQTADGGIGDGNSEDSVSGDGDGDADLADASSLDSDGDTISDADEGRAQNVNTDNDRLPDWQDPDSDGDSRIDRAEAGDSDLATPPVDTDHDGIPDFRDPDSDNDGASDLIEVAVGTAPLDAADNPKNNGDLAVAVPFQGSPAPSSDQLEFETRLRAVDLYVILDRSGSMLPELTTIKNNLATVVDNLTCPPLGTGNPATCIADLWAGAGTVGYSGTNGNPYLNHVDLQPNPNFSGLPQTEPSGCCSEPLTFSVFAAITGQGSAATTGCNLTGVPPRSSCAGSPAANAGFQTYGYPCFRSSALPVIALVTDEVPLSPGDTNRCPNWTSVVKPLMQARGARLMGIVGSGAMPGVTTDLQTMASDTRAVDASNGNLPIVVPGADTNAALAIENGVRALASGGNVDLSVSMQDDATDTVNSVTTFVDHVETLQSGTARCSSGLTETDSDADTHPDTYLGVRMGIPVCWKLVSKANTTVAPTAQPQVFRATAQILGDGGTLFDTRDVYFVVAPANN